MSTNTQPYKGARDFYPEDKRLQKWLFANWRDVCERFGYEEYDAPILEPTDLFLMKGNAEIIQEQTYTFEDRGGRSVTVRTEMTPSISRMVAARRQELNYPLRWYSIPNCWRYERPQRGRGREFYQLNVDLFGEAGIAAEHEMVLMSDALMQVFGAKRAQYTIRINSRAFVDYMLGDYFKLNGDQANAMRRLIDRMSKMPLTEFATKLDACLDPTQRKHEVGDKLLKVLQVKSIEELPEELQKNENLKSLQGLMLQLARDGITNAVFDVSLMRGFDYYTGIVFEVFDTNPANSRSLFGGGRYDGLVSEFGVDPVPTIGFAVGDITMTDFLQTHQLIPSLKPETELAVILIGDVYERAQPLLKELRDEGVKVYVDATGRKLEKQLKNVIAKGIKQALFIGEAELASGQFRLKDLSSQVEQKLSVTSVASAVKAVKQ